MLKLFIKNKKKIYKFQNCNLIIVLKDGWVEYLDEDKEKYGMPLSFFKESNGVGALQISITTAVDKKRLDINKFFKDNGISNAETKEYKLGGWIVYEYEKNDDGRLFRSFYFVKPGFIVYATYNYSLEHYSKKELNEAMKIIKSIEVISKN